MANVTVAQVCNLALAHLNQTQSQISNLDTDTGTTAIQCRIHYKPSLEYVLTNHDWQFAAKRVTLAEISPAPPTTWQFRYDYPSDCLKIRRLERGTRPGKVMPFIIEDDGTGSGLSILTDVEQATALYTWRAESPSLWTPGFAVAFSWYLAAELCPALTGDREMQKGAYEVYQSTATSAAAIDSQEQWQDDELDSPWERARQGLV